MSEIDTHTPGTSKPEIARRLRTLRESAFGEQGIPLLADRLGIPARTWINYETGVTIPGDILLRFLALAGRPVHQMMAGEGVSTQRSKQTDSPNSSGGNLMDAKLFYVSLNVMVHENMPSPPDHLRCPACGESIHVHQPEPDVPHRLLASCSCEECGIWFSLILSPDRTRLYMIRLPSIVELWEVMSRQLLN